MSDSFDRMMDSYDKEIERLQKKITVLARRISLLEGTFSHVHVDRNDGTDICDECGLDIRDRIHEH